MFVCSTYDERFAVEAFDCGQPDLNEWLTRHARTAQAKRTAQVFAWTEEGDTAVLAYFTLCGGQTSARPARRRASCSSTPTSACWPATRTVAARYLVVDAIDDTAVGFYEHYGFTRSPGEPSMRLIRKLGDIQADVDFRS